MKAKSMGDGVCKMCKDFSNLYRGGVCITCTKKINNPNYSMETQERLKVNYTKMRLAINQRKFLTETDTVKKIA